MSSGNSCQLGSHFVYTIIFRCYRFLQELGWNENEESDDDCTIPEQDPAELQQIMMQVNVLNCLM